MIELILIGFIVVLVCVILYLMHSRTKLINFHHEAHLGIFEQCNKERAEWTKERQQLLDRIQAPSFDHLKQAEVRIIKAQKDEKKEPPFELV